MVAAIDSSFALAENAVKRVEHAAAFAAVRRRSAHRYPTAAVPTADGGGCFVAAFPPVCGRLQAAFVCPNARLAATVRLSDGVICGGVGNEAMLHGFGGAVRHGCGRAGVAARPNRFGRTVPNPAAPNCSFAKFGRCRAGRWGNGCFSGCLKRFRQSCRRI